MITYLFTPETEKTEKEKERDREIPNEPIKTIIPGRVGCAVKTNYALVWSKRRSFKDPRSTPSSH